MNQPTLYILSGLPGVGKSSLARALSRRLTALYLRVDTLEGALEELCRLEVYDEGYALAYRLAEDNLRLGLGVVADSCNPLAVTRQAWQDVASRSGAAFVNIEVICSDAVEHRRRVEDRFAQRGTARVPTWAQVLVREYHPWQAERLVIDTAGKSPEQVLDELSERLAPGRGPA